MRPGQDISRGTPGVAPHLRPTIERIARYYDRRKVGDVGPLGFRRSTDLGVLTACLDRLIAEGIIVPDETRFLDLGCADGRVNVLLSCLVRMSVGIEVDDWTLDDFEPLRRRLLDILNREGLQPIPDNVRLFHADSMDEAAHESVRKETGISFEGFDLFYTYLIMHEEFARLVARKARKGAFYLVYGLNRVLPRYEGLSLVDAISPLEGILAVYRKP